MAMGDDDNDDDDGDGATGDEVDDDGDGATGDNNDDGNNGNDALSLRCHCQRPALPSCTAAALRRQHSAPPLDNDYGDGRQRRQWRRCVGRRRNGM